MGYDTIGMLAFYFINFTMINRALEGMFIAATADMAVINSLAVFRPVDLYFFTISVPNLSLLTTGIPRLIKFDYSFFGGAGGFIQYNMLVLTYAVVFLLFIVITGAIVSNLLNRVR